MIEGVDAEEEEAPDKGLASEPVRPAIPSPPPIMLALVPAGPATPAPATLEPTNPVPMTPAAPPAPVPPPILLLSLGVNAPLPIHI